MTEHGEEVISSAARPLHVLILEDNPDDAELQARALVAEGFVTEVRIVDARKSFTEALDRFEPDIILSDYSIPGWSGEDALRLARTHSPDVPFIIVSGLLGEDRAVDLLKQGAWDYVLKDRPARLGPAVRRALQEVAESAERASLETQRQKAEQAVRTAEAELRTALETLLDAVVVLEAVRDESGAIVEFQCAYANAAAVALEGPTDGTLIDQRLTQLGIATVADDLLARLTRVVESGEAIAFESRAQRGSTGRTYDVRAAKFGDGLVVSYVDITARKDAERLLAAQSAVLERIAGGATLVSDLELIQSTVEESLPEARCSILLVGNGGGLLVPAVDASAAPDGIHPSHRRPIGEGADLAGAAAHRGEVVIDGPCWAVPVIGSEDKEVLGALEFTSTGIGPLTPQAMHVAQIAGHLVGLAVERARAQDNLSFLALHDSLTGLPNRTLFLDRLRQLLAQSSRNRRSVAVLFLDIDNFKLTNDTLGHEVGDGLLIEIGRRLESLVRAGDTVARFGGDEFALCCHDVKSVFDATRLAERITARLSEVVVIGGYQVANSFSMGIATDEDPGLGPEELLRRADVAMYRAKERGRSRFEVFNDDLQARVVERHETEQALRAAVNAGEFSVLYQPVIWLASGALMGVEALVRWNRPGRGRLLPQEFIAIAEQSEVIVDIGGFVLTQACRDAAEWLRAGLDVPTVSVNVSVRQLTKPTFPRTVERALDDSGLAPERLCLEITETLMVEEAGALAQKLQELRSIGVRVAMDDFGTGYASLAGLRELPVDIVKVDIRFVQGLHDVRIDRAIVAAVIDLAKELGIVAIAEGVETAEQKSDLVALDCPAAQGFLFSKPMRAQDIAGWRCAAVDGDGAQGHGLRVVLTSGSEVDPS